MTEEYLTDWSKEDYPNFTPNELRCKETGELRMNKKFMDKLQTLRNKYGKKMNVTSAFRSVKHSEEVNKLRGGNHTKGIAVDIACFSDEAFDIVKIALELGFTGIGVSQRGTRERFIHLDTRPLDERRLYGY